MCTSPSDKTISPATLKEKAPVTQDILPKQLDEQELAVKVEPKIIVTEAPQQKEKLDQLKSLEPAEKSTDKTSNGKESKSQSHIKQEQNPKSDVPKSKEATIKELTQDPIEIEAPANQTKVCKSTPTNDVETPNQLVNVSNKPDVSLPPAPGKKPSEAEQPKIEEQKIQQEPSKPEIISGNLKTAEIISDKGSQPAQQPMLVVDDQQTPAPNDKPQELKSAEEPSTKIQVENSGSRSLPEQLASENVKLEISPESTAVTQSDSANEQAVQLSKNDEQSLETIKPSIETKKSATEVDKPVVEVVETDKPEVENGKEAKETIEPVATIDKPAAEADKSAVKNDKPEVENGKGAKETIEPVATIDKPATEADKSTVKNDEPAVRTDEPAVETNEQAMESNNQAAEAVKSDKPEIKNSEEAKETNETVVAVDKPATKIDEKAVGTVEPAAESNNPAVDTNNAAAEVNKPPVESGISAVIADKPEVEPPTTEIENKTKESYETKAANTQKATEPSNVQEPKPVEAMLAIKAKPEEQNEKEKQEQNVQAQEKIVLEKQNQINEVKLKETAPQETKQELTEEPGAPKPKEMDNTEPSSTDEQCSSKAAIPAEHQLAIKKEESKVAEEASTSSAETHVQIATDSQPANDLQQVHVSPPNAITNDVSKLETMGNPEQLAESAEVDNVENGQAEKQSQ
ncbi:hypothetical protein EB796_003841 [Bugula neritina]|uniref:Uncharacterized protein n=1 Tax=Bugula neritina TaxID=10212 RepID=A0A7J7KIX9_BUGNE|nr:hypothetical protein EB796_003841 [Bugula neritina]